MYSTSTFDADDFMKNFKKIYSNHMSEYPLRFIVDIRRAISVPDINVPINKITKAVQHKSRQETLIKIAIVTAGDETDQNHEIVLEKQNLMIRTYTSPDAARFWVK